MNPQQDWRPSLQLAYMHLHLAATLGRGSDDVASLVAVQQHRQAGIQHLEEAVRDLYRFHVCHSWPPTER